MDTKTYETIIRILTDKVDFLEWQLKNAEDERAKLKAEKKELEIKLAKADNEIEELTGRVEKLTCETKVLRDVEEDEEDVW